MNTDIKIFSKQFQILYDIIGDFIIKVLVVIIFYTISYLKTSMTILR